MAFLSRYRTLRGANSEDVDEVEFNFGRAFQQLGKFPSLIRPGPVDKYPTGLHSLAVRHYERVLSAAEKKFPEGIQVCNRATPGSQCRRLLL